MRYLARWSAVKGGVERIEIFRIQMLAHLTERLAKALEMHDLALAQEFERVAHIRIVDQAEQVIIRRARLLLCCNCIRTT